jgi:hypothetical protein
MVLFVGNVVSVPMPSQSRFECSLGSALPKNLRKLGYVPRKAGTVERLMPTSEQGGRIVAVNVEIHEIDL